MASNDAIIHYLKSNVENLTDQAKKIESKVSDGMTLTDEDFTELAKANSLAIASNRVLDIFTNANFNRNLAKDRLKGAVEYMFDTPGMTVHHLKVYNVVITALDD